MSSLRALRLTTFETGWVYVLSNAEHPHLLKIGYTQRSVERRLAELNGAGTPYDHVLRFACHVRDPVTLETGIHIALADWRVPDKEFFEVSLQTAVTTIERIIAEKGLRVYERVGELPRSADTPSDGGSFRNVASGPCEPWRPKPGSTISTSQVGAQMTTEVASQGKASVSLR